jgi:hypothetical protein
MWGFFALARSKFTGRFSFFIFIGKAVTRPIELLNTGDDERLKEKRGEEEVSME